MSTSTQVPERLHKPHETDTAWLLRRIWNRVNRQNMHFMFCIVGREGVGKSHTAIRLADELDASFHAGRVIFDVADLLEILKDGDHEPGQFYVLDEVGVQLGKRTWQERSQVLANQALQLIRNHNLGLFFTLPSLGELDSQTETRLQGFLELTGKKQDKYVEGKWKWIDPDRTGRNNNPNHWFPRRVLGEGGTTKKIKLFRFKPPRPALIQPYEETKTEFQNQFYETTIKALRGEEENGDSGDTVAPKEIAGEIADNGVGQYVSRHNQNKMPYINKNRIRTEHDLTHADALTVKDLLEQQFTEEELEQYA